MHLLKLLGFGSNEWIIRKSDNAVFEPDWGGTYINKRTREVLPYSTVQDILWGDVEGYDVSPSLTADAFIGSFESRDEPAHAA